MSLSYRKIEQIDNKEIAALIRSVLTEFGVNQPGTVFTDPTTDALFELFQTTDACYYLALDGSKIIGGCGLYPTKGLPNNCIELVKFYVDSFYRGMGIGKNLMQISIEKAKELGYKSVYLESLPELDKAVGMYKQAGFKHISERLGESGHFACTILMLKTL
jgi:putative acetyltransferase